MIVSYKIIFVGPVNAAGQAYDPAAETYKKQVGLSLASTMTLRASIMIQCIYILLSNASTKILHISYQFT